MRLTIDTNQKKMEASLKRAAKGFGESNAQAVIRWGVSTCRELAVQTQAYGRSSKEQRAAIEAGMNMVVVPLTSMKRTKATVKGIWMGKLASFPKTRLLKDEVEVNQFIERHRGLRGRTRKLPIAQRGVCSMPIFKRARTLRNKRAGAAKGPWLGAGEAIGRYQKGSGKVTLSKSSMRFAWKHARRGTARAPRAAMTTQALLINRSKHVGDTYVLKDGAIREAIAWGGRKTATWYRKAAKQSLDKA